MDFGRSSSSSRNQKNAETKGIYGGKRLSVLIVDDDPIIRKVHKGVISKLGLNITMAENGKEAVDFYRAGESFDVVIIDNEMPVMDGPTATREIRRMGSNSMILGVTSRGRASEKEAFMEAGLNYCYEKPIKASILKAHLEEFNIE